MKKLTARTVLGVLTGALCLEGRVRAGGHDPALGASSQPADFKEITPELEKAVERGLKFLRKIQRKSGNWEGQTGQYPMAMTGLAGMAFLSAGRVPGRGEDGKAIMKAVNYVLKHQKRGLFDSGREGHCPMYGHGFATTFLAQVYGMEVGDEDLRARINTALTRAVQVIARAQSPEGGWYYTPGSRHHEGSVTVTQMMGLRAAKNVSIDVPTRTIKKCIAYLKGSQNADGSINYQFGRRGSGGRPPLTAAGVEVFLSAGQYGQPHTMKAMKNLRRLLKQRLNRWGHQTYFTYYSALAVFQMGGEDWQNFFPKMRGSILSSQRSSGAWRGDQVGDVYGTAVNVQVLCLPYRYLPIFQR